MPSRCYVPNCKSGSPNCPNPTQKVAFFSPPQDEGLLKLWNNTIPRKDTQLKKASRVCSSHFEEDDIVKGKWISIKNGDNIFFPHMNWTLKTGAIPRIFPGCPSYLNKPKPTKRKEPTERILVTDKRKKQSDPLDILDGDEEPKPVKEVHEKDPWSNFDPTSCSLPPSWYWIISKGDPGVPICVQFQLVIGEKVRSKSVHFNDKEQGVFLSLDNKIIGHTPLKSDDQNESLDQQFTRILKDFDNASICPGVNGDKFASITYCAGAVFNDGVWRSNTCTSIFSIAKPTCSDCYTVKRALGKLLSRPKPLPVEEKLAQLRTKYKVLKKKLDLSDEKMMKMKTEMHSLETEGHILKQEKRQVEAELRVKQGLLDEQAAEMSKFRLAAFDGKVIKQEEVNLMLENACTHFMLS